MECGGGRGEKRPLKCAVCASHDLVRTESPCQERTTHRLEGQTRPPETPLCWSYLEDHKKRKRKKEKEMEAKYEKAGGRYMGVYMEDR